MPAKFAVSSLVERMTPPVVGTQTRRSASVAFAVGAWASLFWARPAVAQTHQADALFEQGKQYLRADNWERACESFTRSFEADPSASTSVKIARCREHEGRTASALLEYQRALTLVARIRQPERAGALQVLIERAIAELEPRVPKLTLQLSPAPANFELGIDGKKVAAPFAEPLPLDPGEHEITVAAPGHHGTVERVTLAPGETRELVLALTPESPAAPPRTAAPPARASRARVAPALAAMPPDVRRDRQTRSARRTWSFILGGASLLTFGAAGYFGVETLVLVDDASNECDFDTGECEPHGGALLKRAGTAQTTALVLSGVGAALATAGVVLYVTESREPGAARAGRVRMAFGATGATLGTSF
jgi:hypothetical protein